MKESSRRRHSFRILSGLLLIILGFGIAADNFITTLSFALIILGMAFVMRSIWPLMMADSIADPDDQKGTQ